MNDNARADLQDDLAYVRALAEEGRNTPLVNGLFYVIWGGLIGSAALIVYANVLGLINLGRLGGVWPWVAAGSLGWILSLWLGRQAGGKPGASTIGNRTAQSVWFSVGIFITIFWITLIIVHDNFTAAGLQPYFLFELMFPVAFGLYGIAFYATATAARAEWLRWFAFAAWGFSVLSLFFISSPHQLLIGALGTIVCALLPGLILMRGEPSEIV